MDESRREELLSKVQRDAQDLESLISELSEPLSVGVLQSPRELAVSIWDSLISLRDMCEENEDVEQ
jgi:hypothetical protein